METKYSDFLGFNQIDKSILEQYIGKECEIYLKKAIYSVLGNGSSFKGIIEKIGNRVLLIKINHKKKDYLTTIFMDSIIGIVLL